MKPILIQDDANLLYRSPVPSGAHHPDISTHWRAVSSSMTPQEFIKWESLSRDTIEVKRCYIDIAGDLVGGILLSQLIYWFLPSKQAKSKLSVVRDGVFWIAKGRDDWWDECRVNARQFDKAIQHFEEIGLVKTAVFKFAGNPMKHISLSIPRLLELLASVSADDPQGCLPMPDRENGSYEIGNNGITKSVISKLPNREEPLTETTAETTAQTKTPSGVIPEKPKPKSSHTEFIHQWVTAYERRFNEKYQFTPRDARAAKRLWTTVGVEKALSVTRMAWDVGQTDGRAFNCKQAVTIHGLQDRWNNIVIELKNGSVEQCNAKHLKDGKW